MINHDWHSCFMPFVHSHITILLSSLTRIYFYNIQVGRSHFQTNKIVPLSLGPVAHISSF